MAAAITFAGPAAAVPPMPALRPGLEFLDGARDAQGRLDLILVDPVRNTYFRLAQPVASVVRLWKSVPAETLRRELAVGHHISLSVAQIEDIRDFLLRNQLLDHTGAGAARRVAGLEQGQQGGMLSQLAQTYLFFRVPLINPDALLERLLPHLAFVFSRGFAVLWLGLFILGAVLVGRQWEAFAAGAGSLINPDALPLYGVLLFALKGVHEMGHALVAKRHGCRVPTMGAAFMMGAPVLYTDTTDTWRLTDRTRRLAVVLAGVGAEMLLVVPALLAWAILPDGMMRQSMVALVTLSLLTSVLVNLNPCMRFDGYFALSDCLDVPNLQERSFARTRAHLRHVLLGLPMPDAGDLTPALDRTLVAFGYITWLYRLSLYIGIAVVVYLMSFKLLGLALFALEIHLFLIRPVGRELRAWWSQRALLRSAPRARLSAALGVALVALASVPWNRVVEAPAILSAREETPVHTPVAARVSRSFLIEGAEVMAGDLLLVLDSPRLTAELQHARAEIAALEQRLTRASLIDSEREASVVTAEKLRAAWEKLAALDRLAQDMNIRAPISGVVVDADPGIGAGVWLNPGQEIARVVDSHGLRARSLLDEADIGRIAAGAEGVFVSESGMRSPIRLKVTAIAPANERQLMEPALSDVYGGPVGVENGRGKAQIRQSLIGVTLESDDPAPLMVERGTVRISAKGDSPLARGLRRILQVAMRESGF